MTEVPTEVFRAGISTLFKKYVSAPTRRDLGTKLQKLKLIATTRSVVEEMISTARGLPPEDEAAGILRVTPGGVVKPVTSKPSNDTYKIKLQDPTHIASFIKMEERVPTRSFGAAKLILPKDDYVTGPIRDIIWPHPNQAHTRYHMASSKPS